MSTKMSTDMNITRPTSRVSRPPGGGSSIFFGESSSKPPASPAKAAPLPPAPTPAKNAPAEAAVVPPPAPVEETKRDVAGKVGIVVGGKLEQDFIVEGIAKALVLAGVKGSVVAKVDDLASLPYAAQNLAKSVDCVIAAAFVPNDPNGTVAAALQSTLLQIGVTGRTPIVPALLAKASLLECKALLSGSAAEWASSAVNILNLTVAGNAGALQVTAAPEVTIKTKPVLTPQVDSVETLMEVLRESLKEHGARGICGIARKFRIADDDNSKSIEYGEFSKVVSEHALGWTPAQVKAVFDFFDADKSGSISFDEFLLAIRGDMNERRKGLVLTAFQILDKDKSGVVELNDLEGVYDASKHPDVIAGKRTAQSVLAEFLDTFDTEEKDGKVTPSEFIKYYANVSASIDDDDYFELMIRNAWHISGGEGWCANSSCRRVLVTHKDGRQTVEEIKNDLGIKADDKEAMLANLRDQGITDVTDIELSSGTKVGGPKKEDAAAAANGSAAAAPAPTHGRRVNDKFGRSSIVIG